MPPEIVEASYVEELAWRAVRFTTIPANLAMVANDLRHGFRQFRDRDILTGPDIDRLFVIVVVQQEVARICQVVDVHELPPGSSSSPAGD